jgi:hypothetical protein
MISSAKARNAVLSDGKADMLLLHVEFKAPIPAITADSRRFDPTKRRGEVAYIL